MRNRLKMCVAKRALLYKYIRSDGNIDAYFNDPVH